LTYDPRPDLEQPSLLPAVERTVRTTFLYGVERLYVCPRSRHVGARSSPAGCGHCAPVCRPICTASVVVGESIYDGCTWHAIRPVEGRRRPRGRTVAVRLSVEYHRNETDSRNNDGRHACRRRWADVRSFGGCCSPSGCCDVIEEITCVQTGRRSIIDECRRPSRLP